MLCRSCQPQTSLLFILSFRGSVLATCPTPLPVDAHYRPITSGSGHEAPGTSGLLLRSLSHDTLARPCTITPSLIAKTPSDSEDTVWKTSLDTHTDGKMGRWTKKQGDSNNLPHRPAPHPTATPPTPNFAPERWGRRRRRYNKSIRLISRSHEYTLRPIKSVRGLLLLFSLPPTLSFFLGGG